MIQRIQTLYLLSLVLISVLLLVIPSAEINFSGHLLPIKLFPEGSNLFQSSIGLTSAMLLNAVGLLVAFLCIFLFKKRVLQLKLSYVLMILWLILTMVLSFLPLALEQDGQQLQNTNYGTILGIFGMLGAYMATRHIKKDIELLKSADRIR